MIYCFHGYNIFFALEISTSTCYFEKICFTTPPPSTKKGQRCKLKLMNFGDSKQTYDCVGYKLVCDMAIGEAVIREIFN